MKSKLWQIWEDKVNAALGLRRTIASGSKFYDISDGQTRLDHPIPFMVDAKSTEQKSYAINAKFMDEWVQKAKEQGKSFGLPLRFEDNSLRNQEYMVISFEDFEMFWELSKKYLEES